VLVLYGHMSGTNIKINTINTTILTSMVEGSYDVKYADHE